MAGHKKELLGSRLPIPGLPGSPPPEQDFREDEMSENTILHDEIGPPGPPLVTLISEGAEIKMEPEHAVQDREVDSSPPKLEQVVMPAPPPTISDKPGKRRGRPPKNQQKTDNQKKRNVLTFEVSEEVSRKFEELFAPGVPGRFKSQSELIRYYVEKGLEKELELMRDFQKVLDRREKRAT